MTPGGTTGADLTVGYAMVTEIGATVASTVGGLEYMDTIFVSGASVASVTFGEGGDGVLGRALDGDVDEIYEVDFHLIDDFGAADSFDIKPNGIVANQVSRRTTVDTGTDASQTTMGFALSDASDNEHKSGWFKLWASTQLGLPRRSYISQVAMTDTAFTQTDTHYRNWVGSWNDAVTNITSLELGTNDGSADIADGSMFILYRRTRNSLRADSASTYERNIEATVAQGTNSEVEYSMGRATYQGSAIGVSVDLDDTVTAGSITVNFKVAGVTKLTATLDTTDTFFDRDVAAIGTYAVAPGDQLVIGIATTGLTTTGGGSPGITVNAALVNDALIASTAGLLDTENTYTKAQTVAPSALVYGANIPVDASLSNVFTVTLTGATGELDNPTNLTDGQTVVIRVTQDVTGGRALTFGTNWDFGADGAPDLTAEAGDALSLISGVTNGTKIYVSSKLGFVA
jgi:hypothetical protein